MRVFFPKNDNHKQRVFDMDTGAEYALCDLVGRTIEVAHFTGGEYVVLVLSERALGVEREVTS